MLLRYYVLYFKHTVFFYLREFYYIFSLFHTVIYFQKSFEFYSGRIYSENISSGLDGYTHGLIDCRCHLA